MELLELAYEDAWGQHLQQMREELYHEALQFVNEQRIRCLLHGAWFLNEGPISSDAGTEQHSWKYAQLSHNRRFLHFGDFNAILERRPELDTLPEKSKFASLMLCVVCSVLDFKLTALYTSSRPFIGIFSGLQCLCFLQRSVDGACKGHAPCCVLY